MSDIIQGYGALSAKLEKYYEGLKVTTNWESISSDPSGSWQQRAADLTKEVLDESRGYAVIGAEHEEDPLVPLRRAVEDVAELMQGVEKLEAEPSEANLRGLPQELAEGKRSIQSLGRALMLSQDPTIAVSAHELLVEAGEAICSR
jgi:hypothetical protein